MTKWNFRVIQSPDGASRSGSCFAIHEVFYDDAGNPTSLTSQPVTLVSESKEDLLADITWLLCALQKDVLCVDGNGKLATVENRLAANGPEGL